MGLNLSSSEIQQIVNVLFLLKSPAAATVPVPTNTTAADSLTTKLDPIGADPRFADIGIGVVDFTADVLAPKIWLHKEGVPWRVASTGKISILLAAVQLREDVRSVKALGIISTPADFDELFSIIWKQSTDTGILQIAEKGSSPRISTIFDLTKTPPDFIGADVALDRTKLSDIGDKHLSWSKAPELTPWERLWLTGAQSDNVAATSCVSEIGVAYMKAVQRGYGLFDPPNGMHLLLGAAYGGVSTKTPVQTGSTTKYRALRNKETNLVTDIFEKSNRSTQPGSAAALTAYMIALMQDKFADADAGDTIRTHLADETDDTATSLIFEGVGAVGNITKAHTKLGILGSLRCEFAFLEADGLKYAVLATGILPKKVGTTKFSSVQQGQDLGKEIHQALLSP